MNMKKNLAIATAVALLAVPALGATNANAANFEDQGQTSVSKYLPSNFDSTNSNSFTKNGHTFNVEPVSQQEKNGAQGDLDPMITGIDGNNNVSNAQVVDALKGNNDNTSTSTNEANNEKSNSVASSSNENQSNTQSGKLAQTGESNTGVKAGVVGAIAAMVSVAFAGVEKFFKRA